MKSALLAYGRQVPWPHVAWYQNIDLFSIHKIRPAWASYADLKSLWVLCDWPEDDFSLAVRQTDAADACLAASLPTHWKIKGDITDIDGGGGGR